MLAGNGTTRALSPNSHEEVEDHNLGVSLLRALHAYFKSQSHIAKRLFRGAISDARVVKLLDEIIAVVRRWHEQHPIGEREAFDRMQLMHSREFADAEARKLRDFAVPGGGIGTASNFDRGALSEVPSRK